MLLNAIQFSSGGACVLSYDESSHWLYAKWSGLIGHTEALQGAIGYLDKVPNHRSAFLLNNNLALQGPWFNSVEWLERTWLPQAQKLGLRYIAHVVQANSGYDILTLTSSTHMGDLLELQLFHDVTEAQDWLRNCQQVAAAPNRASTSTHRQNK